MIDNGERGGAARLQGMVGTIGGRAHGMAGRGRGSGMIADQPGALIKVGRIKQAGNRDLHERRICHVAHVIGVHQPLGLGQHIPSARIGGTMSGDV